MHEVVQFSPRLLEGDVSTTRVPDSVRGPLLTGAVAIMLFFVGFGGWAAFAPLDGAVTGEGTVVVDGNRKSIEQVDGGEVTQIAVTDGQYVKRGDLLLKLDDAHARAEADIDRQQLFLAETHIARLHAELDNQPLVSFPMIVADSTESYAGQAMVDETTDLEGRRAGLAAQQAGVDKQVADLNAQIIGKQSHATADQNQLDSMQQEKAGLASLVANGLTTRQRSLDLERSIYQLQGDLGDTQAAIASLNQEISQLQQQQASVVSQRHIELTTDLINTQSKVLELRSTLTSAEAALQRLSVLAPYEGRVVNMKIVSTGAVLQPGAPILDIVPSTLPLIIDAHVAIDDVSQFAVGGGAEIRLPSLLRPDLPEIRGRVALISADRLTDDRTGQPYYDVTVQVSPDTLKAAGVSLYPGMAATVLIGTQRRTALQYLISPLSDELATSFRQR